MGIVRLDISQTRSISNAAFAQRRNVVYKNDHTFTPTHHFLYYHKRGVRQFSDGKQAYLLKPGMTVLLFRGIMYGEYGYSDFDGISIRIVQTKGDRYVRKQDLPKTKLNFIFIPCLVDTRDSPTIRSLFEEITYLAGSYSPIRALKARALLMELLVELAGRARRPEYGKDLPVDYAIEFLERHVNRFVSIHELAQKASMSRSTLTRRFRHRTGMTVNAFQLHAKIKAAESMFRTSPDIKVREVSETLGFYDEYYFSKVFKKVKGISPREYRKRVR